MVRIRTTRNRLLVVGVVGLAAIWAVNEAAGTPFLFLGSVLGFLALLYAYARLQRQFDVPLLALRTDGDLNGWNGAFGGLVGGPGGFYGSTVVGEVAAPAAVAARVGLALIVFLLACTLFTGGVLQDVADGYVDVRPSEEDR